MVSQNLSLIAIISALSMGIGSITGTFSLVDRFEQSEDQIKQLNDQLSLLEAQLEDTRHENIITRTENTREILKFCDMEISEKNRILEILSNVTKQTTFFRNFDEAERQLDLVVSDLSECQVFPPFSDKT